MFEETKQSEWFPLTFCQLQAVPPSNRIERLFRPSTDVIGWHVYEGSMRLHIVGSVFVWYGNEDRPMRFKQKLQSRENIVHFVHVLEDLKQAYEVERLFQSIEILSANIA